MAEQNRLGHDPNNGSITIKNPYFTYITGAAVALGLVTGVTGFAGLATYLGLAILAQGGLLMTDYIQHYGLTRDQGNDGRLEPVTQMHSWNAPHWFTRHLTLNAPLHSAHHQRPGLPYTELDNPATAPQMPYGPGRMSLMALNPRRWRRVMNPKVAEIALKSRQAQTAPEPTLHAAQ